MALINYPKIEVTTLYKLNQLKKTGNGYVKGVYYYANDCGRIYHALTTKALQHEKEIYIVATDEDRRSNVPKTSGMEYYCVEKNQLWLFDIDNVWKFMAGSYDSKYTEMGNYNGNFMFTNSKSYSSSDSSLRIHLYKINNVVYGRITMVNNPTSELIATLESDYIPDRDTILVIEKNSSSRFDASIERSTGNFTLTDSTNLKSLDTSCKFWYVIE